MQNIGCEFSGVYEYNKITSNEGEQFYTGRLRRDNGESELWSKDWTPFIPAMENITIEKLRLKNDMRDYIFASIKEECEKFGIDELVVEIHLNVSDYDAICTGANVNVLSYKMSDETATLTSGGLYKIKASIEAKTAAWYGEDGRLTAFLKDWRNYGIRKRIINICDWETDPKFIEVEPKDFSNMSDDEIISFHRIHVPSVSGADIAISAYKFGGARHANRIMDIFYKMNKYPVYIDC